MKDDPEDQQKLRDANVKKKDFIKRHILKRKADDDAVDDDMLTPRSEADDIHITDRKRKAEDDPGDMDIMFCMYEEPLAIGEMYEELEECKDLEEKSWSWADTTEEEEMESRDIAEKVYYDDINGNVLYQKVNEAQLGETEALIKMGV